METPTPTKRRGFRWAAIAAAAAVGVTAAIAGSSFGAEVVTAEVTGTTNDVTVTQGGPAVNSTIDVYASGAIDCDATAASPSTATVDTVYSLGWDGSAVTKSSGTPSSALAFLSDGTPQGGSGNCGVTWTGAPTHYGVNASFSASADVPAGDYTINIATHELNPSATTGKLGDTTVTTVTVHVQAGGGGGDTTPPSVSMFALQSASDSGASNSDRITKASTLTYDLVFSESVTGVAASDFSTSGTATGCTPSNVTGSGTTHTVDLTGCSEGTVTLIFAANGATDGTNTGPTSAASASEVTIDRTAPVVASHDDVVVYTMSAPTAVTFTDPTATDANPASPTVTCNPESGSSFAQGDTTVTCSAADTAGNTGQNSFTVTVNVLATTFLQPIDGAPTMNIAKLGRVVPVKTIVSLNGSPVATASTVYVSGASKVNCTSGSDGTDDIEVYAAGSSNSGNLFRWDSTGQYWIYNFDTSAFKLQAGNCYKISVYYGGTVSNGTASGGALAGYFLLKTTK